MKYKIEDVLEKQSYTNIRTKSMLDKMNDVYLVNLAEQIAEQRLKGIPTNHLEEKIKEEYDRIMELTLSFHGDLKQKRKYNK